MAIQPINMDLCIGCGMCENFCPVDVIRFNAETKKPEIAFLKDCMLCLMCEKQCPVKAITVSPEKHFNRFLAWG